MKSLMSGLCSLLPLITAEQLTGAQGGAGVRHAPPIRLHPGKEGVLGEILAGRSQSSVNPPITGQGHTEHKIAKTNLERREGEALKAWSRNIVPHNF